MLVCSVFAERVVVLGDSITSGYGLEKVEAWPGLVEGLAKADGKDWDVVNAGLSGDTTSGGLRRVKVLVRKEMDVLVIALGGNDGLRGVLPAASKKNLVEIVRAARKAHPEVKILLAGMRMPDNMGEAYRAEFRKIFVEVAKEEKVALMPLLIEGIAGKLEFNQADLIHPNVEGQKVIAEGVYGELKKLLEVK